MLANREDPDEMFHTVAFRQGPAVMFSKIKTICRDRNTYIAKFCLLIFFKIIFFEGIPLEYQTVLLCLILIQTV